ncbi:MAG: SusC/RagA family TonB-linked outer membrane protein, partial [Tannerellaceae bacterium]
MKHNLVLFFCLISLFSMQAQTLSLVKGVVTDAETGELLIGVNIRIEGTHTGIVTDLDGYYQIETPAQAKLTFSYVGYKSQTISINGRKVLDVKLATNSQLVDEVVVIGYTAIKKRDVLGAVSSVNGKSLTALPVSSPAQALQGRISGVQVSNASGAPGAGVSVRIRGVGSISSGNDPLYIVDGIPIEDALNSISPNDIENITVLKDASSSAIYGSRANNGVVLITTKQGKMGKPQIQYTGSYAVEARGMEMDRTSGIETAELSNYIHRNSMDHWAAWDEKELESMRNINGGWGYDLIDACWNTPSSTHHALSLSGGNERVRYFINGSYFNQEAFMQNIDYSKYNIRANVEANVNKNMKVIAQLSSSYGNKNNITYGNWDDDLSGIYTHMLCIEPEKRIKTSDGKPVDWGWIGNIGEFSNKENAGYSTNEDQITETLLRMEYSVPFVKGLKAKVQFAYNYKNDYNKTFSKKQTLYQVKREGTNGHIWTDEVIGTAQSAEPGKEYMSQMSNRTKGYQLNLQLDYARTFGKHDLAALLVYEQKEGWGRDFNGGRETFPILVKDQWFATSSARSDSWVGGSEAENGRLSYIGQVNYGYDNKYLLNASLRVDGSMNFPKGKQYGYFPAASAAWVISKENFFHSESIEMLKLRGSAGLTGFDDIIGWQWQESYKTGSNAYLGTSPSTNPGIQFGGVVNPLVTWEKSMSYNIGADLYWKEHFTFSADYWIRNTYDILGERILSLPTSFGFAMPKEN